MSAAALAAALVTAGWDSARVDADYWHGEEVVVCTIPAYGLTRSGPLYLQVEEAHSGWSVAAFWDGARERRPAGSLSVVRDVDEVVVALHRLAALQTDGAVAPDPRL